MPFTTLDPRTALIVVDLQAGITSLPLAHPAADVVARAAELAAAFRRHRLPVVLVTVDATPAVRTDADPQGRGRVLPPESLTLAPELDEQSTDLHVVKHSPGAFARTELERSLRDLGTTQVVVTGISTSVGVRSTVDQAFELGFHVSVPVDAMTDRNVETHEATIAGHLPSRAETGTTAELLALLEATRA